MANYNSLQPTVLINLFKSFCCSFYGSPLWKFNSTDFEKCCKAVRKLLHLPFKTHTWILGPLIGQRHKSTQLQFRNFCFLLDAFNSNNHIAQCIIRILVLDIYFRHGMKQCRNYIVRACFTNAMHNARSVLGHNLAFFRHKYGIDIFW